MSARIIDGNAVARKLRAEYRETAVALGARGMHPGLTVILVGENPASQLYVRNTIKACSKVGIHSTLLQLTSRCGGK